MFLLLLGSCQFPMEPSHQIPVHVRPQLKKCFHPIMSTTWWNPFGLAWIRRLIAQYPNASCHQCHTAERKRKLHLPVNIAIDLFELSNCPVKE